MHPLEGALAGGAFGRFAAALGPRALAAAVRGLLPARQDAEAIPVREWISVDRGQPARLLGFDRTLVWVVIAMLALGLVMVYSASVAMPDNPKFARYAQTFFLTRHAASIGIAFLAEFAAYEMSGEDGPTALIMASLTAASSVTCALAGTVMLHEPPGPA